MLHNSKPFLFIPAIAYSLLILSSCAKKPVCPEPRPELKALAVALDKNYLGAGLVDSAFALWETGTQQQRILLSKSNDSLVAGLKQFATGQGRLSLQLFTQIKFGTSNSSQWVYSKEATINPNRELIVAGPGSFQDAHWKPRVEIKDAVGHFAVVALRPDDPYFFVKDVADNLRKLVVGREYWRQGGGVFKVGGGEWQCSSNCRNSYGHVENSQFFSFLPDQIGNSSWNHIEITVLYQTDDWGGGPVLSLTHTL